MKQKFHRAILVCTTLILCSHLSAQDSWVTKNPIPIAERSNPVCYSIGNKGYYATGWAAVTTVDLLEYNASSDTWTHLPDLPGTPRKGAAGFAIGDKLYIGTGWYDNTSAGTFLNDFWEYNCKRR